MLTFLSKKKSKLEFEFAVDIRGKVADWHTHLLHGVAVAHGDAAVFDGIEVVGDAEGRTDFILAAVALADGACVVVIDIELLLQGMVDFQRLIVQLFGKRENSGLEGRERRVKMHHNTGVVLFGVHDLFVIGFHKEGQRHAVGAEGGFNDVGKIFFVCDGVEIFKALAAGVLMGGEIEIGAACNAPEFSPTEGEEIFEVGRCVGIVGKFLLLVVAQLEVAFAHAEGEQELFAVIFPIGEPFQLGAGLAEEFQLHLFEFANTEDEVARGDLVTEGFSDLADTEGDLAAGGALNVEKVHKNALRGFGAQIEFAFCVFGDALEGFEHEVELANVGKVTGAAVRADDVVVFDILAHLFKGPAGRIDAGVFNEFVGAVAGLAVFAVHQRIGKAAHMAGRHPDLRVHENRGIQADVVGIFLDKFFPPGAFDVVFEFNAEGAVVPGIGKAAVDLAAGIDKASAFAERNDFFHCFFSVVHKCLLRFYRNLITDTI